MELHSTTRGIQTTRVEGSHPVPQTKGSLVVALNSLPEYWVLNEVGRE